MDHHPEVSVVLSTYNRARVLPRAIDGLLDQDLHPTRYEMFNESGLCIFSSLHLDTDWRTRPRPIGRFVSTVWIPGNYLAEGTVLLSAQVFSPDPVKSHFHLRDVVAFHVVDSLDGDSARGDWEGSMPGVVRPLLEWTTTPVEPRDEDFPPSG